MNINENNEYRSDQPSEDLNHERALVHKLSSLLLERDRSKLRAAGMLGVDDNFWRELLGDDVCDYWND